MGLSAGGRALVVDDDAEVRGTVTEWLRLQGFEVSEATNGLEALLRVKRERPQLVVLDLSMPRLGGLDALRRIRVFDPSINVVVVTGSDDPKLATEARRLGAARVLPKPIKLEELSLALDAREAVAAPASDRPREPAPTGNRGRILVVDDDAEFRQMMEELLGAAGYTVRSSPTAASAFLAVTQAIPDVILLDISMPGLSGVDIIPAIQAVSRDVKIIMVSGVTDAVLAKRALAAGAFDFVTKPISTDYLLQTVEAALTLIRLETE